MKISVFGLGYVGTVCAASLAGRGHEVIGVDKLASKTELIQAGRSPIIERDIDELVAANAASGRLRASMDSAEAIAATDLSIVCVGTPSMANGMLNLDAIQAVAREIGDAIARKSTPHTVVIRSTVTPGTTRDVVTPLLVEHSGRTPGNGLGIAFNPEFLREGSSVADFNNPSRTIVGALDEAAGATVMSLYDDLPGSKIFTEVETAELCKYVDNSWHALKVAFANEIGLIAKQLSIDSHDVMSIFCEDKTLNISTAYLKPGFAFGGSCLPKDLRALTYFGRRLDLNLPVLDHILASNHMLIERGLDWILAQGPKRIVFLGLAFKSGTDDIRESPYVELVERLTGKGREVRIFDQNLNLSRLVGGNRAYIMHVLPHVAELIEPDLKSALAWGEVIVVTGNDKAYRNELATLRPEQVVLDFARNSVPDAKPQGFLW